MVVYDELYLNDCDYVYDCDYGCDCDLVNALNDVEILMQYRYYYYYYFVEYNDLVFASLYHAKTIDSLE